MNFVEFFGDFKLKKVVQTKRKTLFVYHRYFCFNNFYKRIYFVDTSLLNNHRNHRIKSCNYLRFIRIH